MLIKDKGKQAEPSKEFAKDDKRVEKLLFGEALEKHEQKLDAQLKDIHPKIIKVLQKYCDLDERDYNIIALWIIGTHFHKEFETYPYLFFNAMKGSGKTRILKLIKTLAYKGELMMNMSEAVLFRTAEDSTICIDEFEHIGSKDKSTLRELLNSAYKQGIKVKRAKKNKEDGYDIEEFKVYCPICMANIWGMESVLGDRCITITLDKSTNPKITRLLEIFDQDEEITTLNHLCSVVSAARMTKKHISKLWNNYITKTTQTTHTTNNINDTNYTDLFKKIEETSLDSRSLELFFPLFILADSCGVLRETIESAEFITKSHKGEDLTENKDVALIDFLSTAEETHEFETIKELVVRFKEYLDEEQEDAKWTNTKWIGRALKRLNLIKDKRRMGKGMEVVINYKKAREKIRLFKEVEPEEKIEVEKIQTTEKSGAKIVGDISKVVEEETQDEK